MTTAPTPSRADALIREHRENMTISSWAADAVDELARLQADNEAMRETLEFVERWAVHHASKPHMTAELVLGSIQHHPEIRAITERYSDGKRPETFDPYARIAELEARKPLPLSIERLEQIWASLRSFHGNEPLKCGHVEFARLVEVEYGVLGRIPIREENGGQIDHSRITGGSS